MAGLRLVVGRLAQLFTPPTSGRLRSMEHSMCIFIAGMSVKYLWALIRMGPAPIYKLFAGLIFGSLKGVTLFISSFGIPKAWSKY